ncbi:MAG: thioredoxin domain-containing protein [Phycisphaerae bacterium]|nr:thioredoxin domain-containing protein [Phycisphaerae bacterium]
MKPKHPRNAPQPPRGGKSGPTPSAAATAAGVINNVGTPWFELGAVLLLVAAGASGMLVADHFKLVDLPGCGAGSGCEKATSSVYGKVPGVGVPVSFLGLAYFGSLLVGWVASRGRVAWSLRGLIWLGGFVSLLYVGLILFAGLFCKWCLAAHVANFVFLLVAERVFRPLRLTTGHVGLTAAVFAALLVGAIGYDATRRAAREERGRELNDATKQQIEQQAREAASRAAQPAPSSQAAAPSATQATTNNSAQPPTKPAPTASQPALGERRVFTGRYRLGKPETAMRVVMFTDYQCPDCRMFEREVMQLVKKYPDELSLSIKHYPFCTQCNPGVPNLHGNACWAARAAEAAGMLGGADAFFKMHMWLFEEKGKFANDEALGRGVAAAGLAWEGFTDKMKSPETLANVKADIEEANGLGIERTPMIFVNGVELKAWNVAGGLAKMVDELAAAKLPARGPENDQPPPAMERLLRLFNETAPQKLPDARDDRGFGAVGSGPEIVMWGDYQEKGSREADAVIRQFVAERGGRYRYLSFPFNKNCNPIVPDERHADACQRALLAEAAFQIGGAAGLQKLHPLLMQLGEGKVAEKLDALAAEAGLDAAKLREAMEGSAAREGVDADVKAGQRTGLQGIPYVFINGKRIPRSNYRDLPILRAFLEEAAKAR